MDRQGSQQELREHQSHYEHHRVRFAEGDQEEIPADNDGLGYRTQRPVQVKQFQRQETPIGGRGGTPATTASTTTAPEVYWADDRENDANLSQYTFYREPTPTPPEGDEREKGLGHGGVIETGYHDHDEPSRQRRIWGFKRRICLIIGAAIVLLIIALGVGLGVGLSNKSSDGAPAESSVSSAPANLGPSESPGPSPTTTSPVRPTTTSQTTSSSTGIRPTGYSDCPGVDNTVYSVPGSSKKFLRLCGQDYGETGSKDLTHFFVKTFEECMDKCAVTNKCTGCGWGYIDGDVGDKYRCWLKTDLKKSHQAASDWNFAILQQ